jgi:hypothetical protein
MAVIACTARSAALRGLGWFGVALMVPVGGVLGLIMLFVGRSTAGAELERVLLVVAILWLIAAAVARTSADPAHDREQRLLDVLDRPVRAEDQPVDGDHQAHAEQR